MSEVISEKQFTGKTDEMVAHLRTTVDKHATAIIDGKSEFIIAYTGEGGNTCAGACAAPVSLALTMSAMDTCGRIHGQSTGTECEDETMRTLLVALMVIRELYKESDKEKRLLIQETVSILAQDIYNEIDLNIDHEDG
jgi:hypothetical protein